MVDHKCHEDVSPALAYGSIMPVQLHQSALWAAHIQRLFDGFVERARNTFASSPDQGDGLTMQLQNGAVNHFVVKYFMNYIFCSSNTQRSFRDYKVSDYGGVGIFSLHQQGALSQGRCVVYADRHARAKRAVFNLNR